MKRIFVFQDFKSQKFWSIDVRGTDIVVNYGKLGTDGQTQVKNFLSVEEAEKAAAKLVAEKTKKGYVETREEVAKEMKVEAKKYALSYDEAEEGVNLMDRILKDKKLPSLRQITKSTADCRLRAYVAQGEVLPVATRSFGSIGIFAIPEMGRFYRHVLIEKNFPHHGAVAFGHYGKALFEIFKLLGVEDLGYNQPKEMRYPTENPFA